MKQQSKMESGPRKQKTNSGTGASLMAWWSRIHLPVKEMQVRSLVWEHPTCLGAAGPGHHNHSLWSRARALQQEEPLQREAGAPQPEKNPHTVTKTQHSRK